MGRLCAISAQDEPGTLILKQPEERDYRHPRGRKNSLMATCFPFQKMAYRNEQFESKASRNQTSNDK